MDTFMHLPALDRHVRAITTAGSPAEVLRILRDGCRLAAPRAAVFLARKGQLIGWSSIGYTAETAAAQKTWTADAGADALGRFRSGSEHPLCERGHGVKDPDFGQPDPGDSVSAVVELLGKPIAVIVAERSEGEGPWHPEALATLLSVASIRLELDVVKRRAEAAAATATPAPSPPAPELSVAIPLPVEQTTELAPAPEPAPTEPPEIEAARRYARLVATDIRLYNEEAVLLGRRNGDLARRLGTPIGRGKVAFLQRHGDLGPVALELLHDAYVQVLAAGNPQLIPSSALD